MNPSTASRFVSFLLAACRKSYRQGEYGKFMAWRQFHADWVNNYLGAFKGQDCFLLCNGPSLNRIDLNLLSDRHLIGLNKIYLLQERAKLDFTFHVSVNQLVISQSAEEFKKMDCPSFLSWDGAHGVIEDKGNIHYLCTNAPLAPSFCSNPYQSPICEGWTVTYVALQLAYMMGFENVFIVGMDHNFVCKGEPNEAQSMGDTDPNHFDPNYFAGHNWQLPDLEGSEASYRQADFAFRRRGRRIIDATVGGKCNIFEKMTFEDALRECRVKYTLQ
jgi:hypothetical protein